jgi:methanogenic corrinoid protein MtbC1
MSSHRTTQSVPFAEVCNWDAPLPTSWIEARKRAEPKVTIRAADLDQVIEEELIPRLMLLHKKSATKIGVGTPSHANIDEAFVIRFAQMTQELKGEELQRLVLSLIENGATAHTILLDLFAPAARLLGESWVSDEIDFVSVTIGLSRIQQLVHDVIAAAPPPSEAQIRLKALIVPAPGEQHSLGAVIVGHVFRTSGWIVDGGLSLTLAELEGMMKQDDYAVLGFSLASEIHVANVASTIRHVRKLNPKRELAVIVGGNLAACRPELCAELGADLLTTDVAAAIEFGNDFAAATGRVRNKTMHS